MDHFSEHYHFRNGEIYYRSDARDDGRHVCGPSRELAVCYDRKDGVLHKHGSAERVNAWARETQRKLVAAGFGDLSGNLVTVSFPPLAECLDELNACIATTGRIMRFPERLAEIGAAAGPVQRYPA